MPPQTMRQFLKPPEKAPDTLPRTQSTMSLLDYFSTVIQGLADPTGWTEPKAEDFDNPHAYTQALKAHGVGQLIQMAAPLAAPLAVMTRGARTEGAAAQTLKAYHGSPNMLLEDVSATPKVRQFPNAQSELGAFATLDEEEAARYADINRKGTGGRVYPVDLSLKNPKELKWSEFSRFNDITKDKAGKSLPNTQWDQRNQELIQEAKQFRADLEAKGHDGIVVRDTKGNPIEVASFKDIPLRQRALPFNPQTLKAFHGSPHDFGTVGERGAFTKSAIGSGEGGQAYGYGHYFAQNPAVADEYKRQLAGLQLELGGKPLVPSGQVETIAESWLKEGHYKHQNGLTSLSPEAYAREGIQDMRVLSQKSGAPGVHDDYRHALDKLEDWGRQGLKLKAGGKTYELNLHTSPESLLDWDKPLSQQPHIIEKLKQAGLITGTKQMGEWEALIGPGGVLIDPKTTTGDKIYSTLVSQHGGRAGHTEGLASQQLAEAGIHGVQYLDQGSRGAQMVDRWTVTNHAADGHSINSLVFPSEAEAKSYVNSREYAKQKKQFGYAQSKVELIPAQTDVTRNYVIFPHFEHLIEISKKYGISLPAAASLYKWQQSQKQQKGVE